MGDGTKLSERNHWPTEGVTKALRMETQFAPTGKYNGNADR